MEGSGSHEPSAGALCSIEDVLCEDGYFKGILSCLLQYTRRREYNRKRSLQCDVNRVGGFRICEFHLYKRALTF